MAGTMPVSVVTVGDGGAAARWQTLLGLPAAGHASVPLPGAGAAERKLWAARLDHAIRSADAGVLLVAEGIGCVASAWWARLSPAADVRRVSGALLFPGNVTPAQARAFASPATSLPFPTLVLHGDAEPALAATIAGWGARLLPEAAAAASPLRPAPWRYAQRLLLQWTQHVAEHEVERGYAMRRLDPQR